MDRRQRRNSPVLLHGLYVLPYCKYCRKSPVLLHGLHVLPSCKYCRISPVLLHGLHVLPYCKYCRNSLVLLHGLHVLPYCKYCRNSPVLLHGLYVLPYCKYCRNSPVLLHGLHVLPYCKYWKGQSKQMVRSKGPFTLSINSWLKCDTSNQLWCDAFLDRVATAQRKQGIWFLLFPDRENTGNFFITQGKFLRHRENIFDCIHWCKKHISFHIFFKKNNVKDDDKLIIIYQLFYCRHL